MDPPRHRSSIEISTQSMHRPTSPLICDFDPARDVSFNFWKNPTNSKKSVYVNCSRQDKKRVNLALCKVAPDHMLLAPFGVSEPMAGMETNGRLAMEVVPTKEMKEKIKAFDEEACRYVHSNSEKCFGKRLELSQVKDRFNSPLRESTAEGKNDLLRLKLNDDCKFLQMKTYADGEAARCSDKHDKSIIQRGSMLAPNVDISQMWFVSGDKQWGYSLYATQIVVDRTSSENVRRDRPTGAAAFVLPEGFTMTVVEEKNHGEETELRGGGASTSSPRALKRTADEAGLLSIDGTVDLDAALENDAAPQRVLPHDYL